MYLSKMILATLVALALFAGGIIILLFSKTPIWSVFLGIGASQAGIISLILTFEKLSRDEIDDEEIEKQLAEIKLMKENKTKTKVKLKHKS